MQTMLVERSMNEMKKTFAIASCVVLTLALASCGATTQEPLSPQQVEQLSQKRPNLHIQTSEEAKQIALQNNRVDEAAAVATDKDLSVAVRVSNFNRLRLQSIRKDVHGKLRKAYPKHEIHVTTDSKIFAELKKLESSLKKSPPPQKRDVEKRLKKLNDDMRG
jgi:hypothetical protein